jgi:gluconokinase
MTVLGLDLGSSSVRAIVFGEALRPVAMARRAAALRQDAHGAATFDGDAYVDTTAACIDELHGNGVLAGVTAVAASCQWHSLLPLDAANRPIGPGLSWLDTRATGDSHRRPADPTAYHSRTGAWWHPLYWPMRIAWLRAQGVPAQRWSGLAEHLANRLLGSPAVSVSYASGTGALDTSACVWDPEALDLAGVTGEQVSVIAPDGWRGRLAPAYARRWPELASAEWALPVGDGAASAIGTGCMTPQRLSVTVGTSAAVRLVCPGTPPIADLVWRYRVDSGRSVVGAAYSGGGVLHHWVTHLVGGDPGEAALEALAPGQHGLVALPYHAGLRPPRPADASGTLHGLRLSTTPVDVVAATSEGFCHEVADGGRLIDPDRKAVAVLGGGAVAASAWLARRLAAAFGGKALRCLDAEVGARGAAALALGVEPILRLEPVEATVAEVAAMAQAAERHSVLRGLLSTAPP